MDESSQILVEMLQDGSEEAAEEIFDRYVRRLIELTRARLSARLGQRVDPEDVVQSAFRSFFRKASAGDFKIADPGDLWRLLTVITLNKLRRSAEFHSAQKRNYSAERSPAKTPEEARRTELPSQGPAPDQELETLEEIRAITDTFTDDQKRMVELRLQGYQLEEIAEDLSCSERTVRRVISRFRERLEERLTSLRGDA